MGMTFLLVPLLMRSLAMVLATYVSAAGVERDLRVLDIQGGWWHTVALVEYDVKDDAQAIGVSASPEAPKTPSRASLSLSNWDVLA
eukprot:scaffold3362_cov402-Prasinococcus_capsulatus_cf.AAC.17